MKRIIGTATLLLAFAAPAAVAQTTAASDHGSHHGKTQEGKAKLDAEMAEHFKGITLTDAQVQKLVEIKTKHHKAMDALKKEAKDPADETLKSSLKKQMDAEHTEFKAVLTTEQVRVFEENMKAHHTVEARHDMKEAMKHEPKPSARKPR